MSAMGSPSRSARASRRTKRQRIIVIDSDGEDEGLRRRKAALKGAKSNTPCIDLLDSDDEDRDTDRGIPPAIGKLKSPSQFLTQAEKADRKLAEQLQREENLAGKRANARREKKDMTNSSEGKAVLAVQEIIALTKMAKEKYIDRHPALQQHSIEAVTFDDMVFFAKDMLDLQQQFLQKQIPGDIGASSVLRQILCVKFHVRAVTPHVIDVGFHYTDRRNVDKIRTHGLLTKGERDNQKVQAAPKGRYGKCVVVGDNIMLSIASFNSQPRPSVFGDGIYTANNESAFSNFGDTGLIVGRLKGHMVRVAKFLPRDRTFNAANTVVGDKLSGVTSPSEADADGWPIRDSYHEIVLQSSAQCLPMIKFENAMRQNKEGIECIQFMKKSLQKILDKLFNKGLQKVEIRSVPLIAHARNHHQNLATGQAPNPPVGLPMPSLQANPAPGQVPNPSVGFPMPSLQAMMHPFSTLMGHHANPPMPLNPPLPHHQPATFQRRFMGHHANPPMPLNPPTLQRRRAALPSGQRATPSSYGNQTLKYKAPKSLSTGIPSSAFVPPPRLRKRGSRCVTLKCMHSFHSECIELAFKTKPQCPVCRTHFGDPRGKSPSGTMTVTTSPIRCSGYQEESILITYSIPSGTQENYHDHPGRKHGSKHAAAYLPNNIDGQNLLKRLKYSFLKGLTFTVGTSVTTGLADQCTWYCRIIYHVHHLGRTSVHHKTSPTGGTRTHGFPDPGYFQNSNGELDGLGVPSAQELNDDGSAK
ncbi:hypothetical protein ACHAWF_018412 [Thalassiosira exigua]